MSHSHEASAMTDAAKAASLKEVDWDELNQLMNKIEAVQADEDYADKMIAAKEKELADMKKAHTARIANLTKQSRKNRSKARAAAGVGDHAAGAFDEGRIEEEEDDDDVPYVLRQQFDTINY